ncbi:hypothetical protein ADUPG1_009098 [Aduncisulcus paluster]|uniref:Uncharacterized protein n=1 Tax=Aduncisulcus paluster TaxID=2918883 RepID=A0ABQ5KUD5_9EUKA|nr:hypothetical protein ADUPG1_009098 [Aduncisulcus paluster]
MGNSTLGVVFGTISICCWMFAQFPQIIKSCKAKEVESLSGLFILAWLLGDSTNLIGALLTNGIATQIAAGIYYFIVDMIMIGMYIMFRDSDPSDTQIRANLLSDGSSSKSDSRDPSNSSNSEENEHNPVKYSDGFEFKANLFPLFLIFFALFSGSKSIFIGEESEAIETSPVKTLEISTDSFWYKLGIVIGYISAFCYLSSRVFQIVKNAKNKLVDGLSPIMFVMAVLANSFYVASIFATSTDADYLIKQIPWLLGSGGVVLLDFTVLIQYFSYRQPTLSPSLEEEEDSSL